MNDQLRAFWGTVTSWSGVFAVWTAGQIHLFLGIVGTLVSIISTVYVIRVSRASLADKELEILKHTLELERIRHRTRNKKTDLPS